MKKKQRQKARLARIVLVSLLVVSSDVFAAQTGVYQGVGTTTAVPAGVNVLTISSDDTKSGLYAASSGTAAGFITSDHSLNITNSFNHDTSVAHNNYGTALYAYDMANSAIAAITVNGDVNYLADTNAYADVTARGKNSTITINGKLTGSTNSRLSAIYATDGSKITASAAEITMNKTTDIYGITRTNQTQGVIADKGSQVNITGNLKLINNNMSNNRGIYAGSGSTIHLGSYNADVNREGIVAKDRSILSSNSPAKSQIIIDGAAVINARNGYAICANDTSTIKIDSVDITQGETEIGSNYESAITADGTAAQIDVTNLAKVNITSSYGNGLNATTGGVINVGSADITAGPNSGSGIYATRGNSNGVLYRSKINVVGNATIVTSKSSQTGITAKGATVTAGSTDITCNGQYSKGLYALEPEGKIEVAGLSKVKMTNYNGIGLYATMGGVINTGSADVSTSGDYGYGLYAKTEDFNGVPSRGKISVSGDTTVVTSGNYGYGLYAKDGDITLKDASVTTAGDNAHAIVLDGTSVINAESVALTTNGAAAHGVKNGNGGILTVTGGAINANGIDSYGINTFGSDPAAVSTLNLTGVIVTASTSKIAVYGNGNGLVNGTGVTFNGDIVEDQCNGTDGTLNVNLQNASTFNGAAHLNVPTSILNLSLQGNSVWNMTGDSEVSGLENTNSLVDMHSANAGYSKLTIGSYRGTGGTFKMDTDLNSETNGDKVTMTTATAGTTKVQVYDVSLTNGKEVTGVKNLLLITDSSKTATFVGENLNKGGLWDVTPELKKGTEALDANGQAVGTDDQWYLTKIAKTVNPDTKVLLNADENSYISWRWRMTDDTLRQRLGDLRRNTNTKDADGVWARYRNGRYSGSGIDGSYGLFQLGYDKMVHKGATYGLTYETGAGRSSYTNGYSQETVHDFSLYGTWYDKNGSYTDVIGSYGTVSNDINSYGDYPDSSDSSGKAYRLSFEHGRTIDLNKHGTFIEPQAQLILGRLGGRNYRTDRQTQMEVGAANSVIGRLGFVLGQKTPDKNDIYLKASILREFAGKQDVDMAAANGEILHQNNDYGETWYTLGLGGNWNLSKVCHFYTDMERTFGADVNKTLQFNAGLRFEF